ncbi:MAG: (2Fe-2S)-binding protein [Deltaproteobacteria bacterium]|nr:MAG: (2Fe-2S)-binding protein [Deltaproteobacteria bacterium]
MDQQEIIEGLKPVCLCKNIKKRVFLKYIAEGKTTLEELRAATGAGSGPCGGKRCTPKILALLEEKGFGTRA